MKKVDLLALCLATTIISNSVSPSFITNAKEDVEVTSLCPQDKISVELSDKINESIEESLPVVVWLNEENISTVENLIEEEIGYNFSSIEEQYEYPSQQLIDALGKAANDSPEEYLDLLMKNHIELTSGSRKREKERTELYRSTRRNIVKELNSKRMDSFFNEYPFLTNSTNYVSSYSPMIVCNLSVDEITALSEADCVNSIMYYEPLKIEECSINLGTTTATVGVDAIRDDINLDGQDIKIGIYETCSVSTEYAPNFDLSTSEITHIGPYYNNGSDHSTYCAGIAAGNNGVAPGAVIYSASCEEDWQNYDWNNYDNSQLANLETLIDSGVDLISISWGSINGLECYNYWSKYMDSLISNTSTTIVCATGNNGNDYIMNPSSAYNCIAVNGFIDNYNGQVQNILNNYSYQNGSGCFKPDVVAPSLNNGTSTATPYIAGMIALMYQYKPSLAASPELTKAILIGSCHKKCNKLLTGSTLSNISDSMGLCDRQGAGIPNVYTMVSIVSQHTYGNGVLDESVDFERKVNFIQPKYNSEHINVSMAFLQTNVPTGAVTGTRDDYDLSITNNGGTYGSAKANSSTEVVYHSLTSDSNYTMRIYKYSGASSEVKYAYAWSTDNERFYNNRNEEGVYCIKNYKSSLYLSLNEDNNKSQQKEFNNDLNSLWVLDCNNGGTYSLKNAIINSSGLGLGANISNTNYYAIDGSNASVSNISVDYDSSTGTYSFKRSVNGATYALGIYQQSSTSNAYAAWSPFSVNNKSQKWYLETANYRSGDTTVDGIIDSNDHQLAMEIIINNITPNNLQRYLTDVNKDNVINIQDAVIIGTITAEN